MGIVVSYGCCGSREADKNAFPRHPRGRGNNMLQLRIEDRKARDLSEGESGGNSPCVIEEPPPLMELPVSSPRAGRWMFSGFHEQIAMKVGMRRLDSLWSDDELLVFPKRPDKGPVLKCEKLMRDLLSEDRALKAVPPSDVAAAQGDIRHLSVRQLLKLRVACINFVPRGESHAAFVTKVDILLFEELGKKAAAGFPSVDSSVYCQLGFDVVLISAAASVLQACVWWVCWYGEQRVFFNVASFTCSETFPQRGGVLEIEDSTRLDHNSQGMLRVMEWQVTMIDNEQELSIVRVNKSQTAGKAGAMGANVNAPHITLEALNERLISLNKTGLQ